MSQDTLADVVARMAAETGDVDVVIGVLVNFGADLQLFRGVVWKVLTREEWAGASKQGTLMLMSQGVQDLVPVGTPLVTPEETH